MTFDHDQAPMQYVAQLLEQASANTGFTPDQIKALVDSELDTDHLLDYISAVMSHRMN